MHLNFILIEPKVAENIGASARAIKTMGFDSLIMIKPVSYLDGKAKWLAHGSYDILENAKIFSNLDEAIKSMDLVIGTTSRYRLVKQDYLNISELNSLLQSKQDTSMEVAIVFGREESGLTNDEISLCDITTSVPLANDFPSLNLSQAVMLYAYELSKLTSSLPFTVMEPAGEGSVRALKKKVDRIISLAGVSGKDMISGRINERIALAGDKDIKLMHSIASAVLISLENK
jgi:tRNA/rRNA methyltransferase